MPSPEAEKMLAAVLEWKSLGSPGSLKVFLKNRFGPIAFSTEDSQWIIQEINRRATDPQ